MQEKERIEVSVNIPQNETGRKIRAYLKERSKLKCRSTLYVKYALYMFLSKQKPDGSNSIGKVCPVVGDIRCMSWKFRIDSEFPYYHEMEMVNGSARAAMIIEALSMAIEICETEEETFIVSEGELAHRYAELITGRVKDPEIRSMPALAVSEQNIKKMDEMHREQIESDKKVKGKNDRKSGGASLRNLDLSSCSWIRKGSV